MDKVNPMATFLTAKLMFDWLGEKDLAARLENACARVIKEGKIKTYDVGGNNKGSDVAKEVAKYAA
jgi:isocitrate/isopropylmalate dehydrogenase